MNWAMAAGGTLPGDWLMRCCIRSLRASAQITFQESCRKQRLRSLKLPKMDGLSSVPMIPHDHSFGLGLYFRSGTGPIRVWEFEVGLCFCGGGTPSIRMRSCQIPFGAGVLRSHDVVGGGSETE
jgi:hypothetical protein